jgi:glycosyltransferase involved in cell wall biosynthesis
MKIIIDARFYGLEHAGLGRYTMNLVQELARIDRKNSYLILLRKKYFEELKLPGNWQKVLADFKHYTLAEQRGIPKIIKREKPDLVHFLHFNVPFLVKAPYIVTIHDIVMHKSHGRKATTLPIYLYLVKRIGYKLVFRNSVKKAQKIIVPSHFVKKELVAFYKLNPDKVEVIYEGVS